MAVEVKIRLQVNIMFNFLGILFMAIAISQPDFLAEQKRYKRVRAAFHEKEERVETMLKEAGVSSAGLNVLFLGFKDEKALEIFVKNKADSNYRYLSTYKICAGSGGLGPKRKEGDRQVPEGFYHIDRFNPASTFYLSLGVNYPNEADQMKSAGNNPGGDIFIHGSCVTIGCLPMTDDQIKEIYLFAILARQAGQQKIPVYLFPFKMTDKKMEMAKNRYNNDLISFWETLKPGYDQFQKAHKELEISVDENGNYEF